MKFAKDIIIQNYRSNIQVFTDFGEKYPEKNGRILLMETTSDSHPDATYKETIETILTSVNLNAGFGITRQQAQAIADAVNGNVSHAWNL